MEASAVPREAAASGRGLIAPRLLRAATDVRLVGLVREGHAAAFEAIYDRYNRPIMSFCRHMLGDPEEAADAVQQTFTSAYTALTQSTKPVALRPWLFTIARNRCYDLLRARREQPPADLVEPATEGLAAQVQRREELRELLVDMRGLPDEQRAALVLTELGALSHVEVGAALGVAPAKVKALVFQARESLLASRSARDTDCAEIRRELANARGAALRRANLRRHLRQCQGCREYRTAVQRQRRSLAAILPVAPVAGLKEAILGATTGGGATGGAGGGLLASSALKGLVVKGLVGGSAALLAAGGTIALVRILAAHGPSSALADTAQPSAGATGGALHAGEAPFPPLGEVARRAAAHRGSAGRGGSEHRAAVTGTSADSSGRILITSAVLAVRTRRHRVAGATAFHRATPRLSATTVQPSTSASAGGGQGATQPGDSGPGGHGHGHGSANRNGHQPGQNPGLHLGWGQGDGGGQGHPHGANPHG